MLRDPDGGRSQTTSIASRGQCLNSPGHLLGTARMGTDPERSVVNEWGAATT